MRNRMEAKRKRQIRIETSRRLVVRLPDELERVPCPVCPDEEPMITAEDAAAVFALSRREIYRLVETGRTHFAETASGVLLICANNVMEHVTQRNGPSA